MKTKFILIFTLCIAFQAVRSQSANPYIERTVLAALRGDEKAKADLASVDKSRLLRRLQLIALQRSMDRPTVQAALEMIKTIPGHCQYYRDKIVNDKTGGMTGDIFEALDLLVALKTEESLKTAAEFLFDPSEPTGKGDGDIPDPGPNRITALYSLSEGKIEGTPEGQVNTDTSDALLIEWKAWATKTYGITSFGGLTPNPPKTPKPTSFQPTVAASPLPSATPKLPSTKSAFPLSVGLVLLAVVLSIAAIYYFLNRKN